MRRLATGERWDLVFNISEGLAGFGRESQVPAVLEAYGIAYTFSDPLVLAAALHKPTTKRLVKAMGIPTPEFAVVEKIENVSSIDLPYPLFVKPAAEGTSKGISDLSIIHSRENLLKACDSLLSEFKQPVLVETYLPGREFTVGVLGTGDSAKAVAVMEVTLKEARQGQAVYSYINKENSEELAEYRLADDECARASADVAIAAWKGLGCRDAGRVDIRADINGNPNFIEVNPLAGLHPGHSDLPIMWTLSGKKYNYLVSMIVESAVSRPPILSPHVCSTLIQALKKNL